MKSEHWAMIAGAFVGSILGIYIGTKMIKNCESCQELKRENKMLRDVNRSMNLELEQLDSLNSTLILELQQIPYVDGQCKE
jgi:Mg2+/Co2+ transporter CorB